MKDSTYNCETKDCVFYETKHTSVYCRLDIIVIEDGKCLYYTKLDSSHERLMAQFPMEKEI